MEVGEVGKIRAFLSAVVYDDGRLPGQRSIASAYRLSDERFRVATAWSLISTPIQHHSERAKTGEILLFRPLA